VKRSSSKRPAQMKFMTVTPPQANAQKIGQLNVQPDKQPDKQQDKQPALTPRMTDRKSVANRTPRRAP